LQPQSSDGDCQLQIRPINCCSIAMCYLFCMPTTAQSPVQQELFEHRKRGGRRRGAGRKSLRARPGRRHARRPDFRASHPLHVVMRVEPVVGSLRRRAMYRAMRAATLAAARRGRVRIVHISLQRTHVHMLVEAAHRIELARGMQGFQISAARHINRVLGGELRRSVVADEIAMARRRGAHVCRRGRVFRERYYTEVITSPTQAHRTIRYVLSNWRRHGEDRVGVAKTWLVDPFSTGSAFDGWAERRDPRVRWPGCEDGEALRVVLPRTWLLAVGWKRIGEISARTVPGPSMRVRGAACARHR